MHMEVSKLTNKKGFTLIEALIAMGIVAFVVVSILNAFIHQMHANKNTNTKNVAITLAEDKIEEYLKFPSDVMPGDATDYIVLGTNKEPVIHTSDPGLNGQFRRRVTITANGNLNRIRVSVYYGFVKKTGSYPFGVVLTTLRGL